MNKKGATYKSGDPVAACVGAEREDQFEILVLIDEDLETTYLVPKDDVPMEFRKYGLPVWLISDEGNIRFENRTFVVTAEMRKEQEEVEALIASFDK